MSIVSRLSCLAYKICKDMGALLFSFSLKKKNGLHNLLKLKHFLIFGFKEMVSQYINFLIVRYHINKGKLHFTYLWFGLF